MDNLRRFILVFVAIIFITLSVCGIVLADSYNKSARTEEKDLNVSAATFDPKGDPNALNPIQENILFLVGDKDGGETELMLIANFNAKASTVSFLYLPKDMKFAINSEKYVGNLGMLLAKTGSAEKAVDTVSSFLDLGIKYYIQIPCQTFAELVDAYDSNSAGVSYTVPADLRYQAGKYNIDLKKDTKILRGQEAMQLIQFYQTTDGIYPPELYAYYDGTDIKRVAAAQSFLKAFISQKLLNSGGAEKTADTFAAAGTPLLSKCETNLNEENLKQIGDIFSKIGENAIQYYRINGTDQYVEKYYLIYNETCTNMDNGAVQESKIVFRERFSCN